MQHKLYFTRPKAEMYASDLIGAMDEQLTDRDYSDDPMDLTDGTLYRVTIERVGVVRTAKEVEFDSAEQEESN